MHTSNITEVATKHYTTKGSSYK